MANLFLAKTDPDTFSIHDFELEKITRWDGVHNYQAINFIKNWQIGDLVLIYHSQIKNPAIVGISKVVTKPEKDENDKRNISWFADLELIQALPEDKQITLSQIKANPDFQDFLLIKQSRLSVMPCPDNFANWIKTKLDL